MVSWRVSIVRDMLFCIYRSTHLPKEQINRFLFHRCQILFRFYQINHDFDIIFLFFQVVHKYCFVLSLRPGTLIWLPISYRFTTLLWSYFSWGPPLELSIWCISNSRLPTTQITTPLGKYVVKFLKLFKKVDYWAVIICLFWYKCVWEISNSS